MVSALRVLFFMWCCVTIVACTNVPQPDPRSTLRVFSVPELHLPAEHCAGQQGHAARKRCDSTVLPAVYNVLVYPNYDDQHKVVGCYTLIAYDTLNVHVGGAGNAATAGLTWRLLDISPIAFSSVAFSGDMEFGKSEKPEEYDPANIVGSLGHTDKEAYAQIVLLDKKYAGKKFGHGARVKAQTREGASLDCKPLDPGIIVNAD